MVSPQDNPNPKPKNFWTSILSRSTHVTCIPFGDLIRNSSGISWCLFWKMARHFLHCIFTVEAQESSFNIFADTYGWPSKLLFVSFKTHMQFSVFSPKLCAHLHTVNPFSPRPAKTVHFVILLCLTPDNITHWGRASGWERVNLTYLPISLP